MNGHIYKIICNNKFTFKKRKKMSYPYENPKFKQADKALKKDINNCNNDFVAINTNILFGNIKNTRIVVDQYMTLG